MATLFNTYLYQPILWLLVFIYQHLSFGDLGLAIILLTVVVRIVLLPLFYKGAKDQALMQRLQPAIKKIQTDHKDNKEVQALMALYKEHRLNPFSGFLLLLIQLPIFIALFQIFSKGLAAPVFDSRTLFGLIDLGAKSIVVVLIAAALQYVQGKLTLPPKSVSDGNPMASAGKFMIYVGPVISIIVFMNLPSALSLYWTVSTIFSIGQQLYINKKLKNTPIPGIGGKI